MAEATLKRIQPVFKEPLLLVHVPDDLMAEIRGIVQFFFHHPVAHYIDMDTEKFRRLVFLAQRTMQQRDFHSRLTRHLENLLTGLLPGVSKIEVQPPRLRAVRPHVGGQEAIGWHREGLYGTGGEINIWVAIQNVCVGTAMLFVPGSDKIKDEDLQTSEVVDESCNRQSAGHQIGLLDIEKKIVGGVDFTRAMPLVVLPGECVIFDGRLIHGSGLNRSEEIRFSADWRAVGEGPE